jgi:short-subunit dehydrogenase
MEGHHEAGRQLAVNVAGSTIWLTGASSGIGEALAGDLARRGARLVLSSRRPAELERVRQSLVNPSTHWVVPLDLGQPEALRAIVDEALPRIGPVHALINNGGVSQRAYAADTDLSIDRRLIEVNYLGAVAMTKALLPQMLARGAGSIVTVASVAGKVGSQLRSGYSGSKHAVIGFMDCLRAEVWGRGIRVVVACPGWVRTDISLNALNARGEPENVLDRTTANGISAEACALAIIRAMEQDRDEVIIGRGLSRIAPLVKRIFPGALNWLNRRKAFR